jgi:hypothetical protein
MSDQPMGVTAPVSMKTSNLVIDPGRDLLLSSFANTPYSRELDLFEILDGLINGWCQRRALRPLAYVLPAYPGVLAPSDSQFQLLEALKNLKRFCLDHLTPEELRLVTQAHDFLDERLRACVI